MISSFGQSVRWVERDGDAEGNGGDANTLVCARSQAAAEYGATSTVADGA
jgi:hypothetical protein